jgi:hypothetical protein
VEPGLEWYFSWILDVVHGGQEPSLITPGFFTHQHLPPTPTPTTWPLHSTAYLWSRQTRAFFSWTSQTFITDCRLKHPRLRNLCKKLSHIKEAADVLTLLKVFSKLCNGSMCTGAFVTLARIVFCISGILVVHTVPFWATRH